MNGAQVKIKAEPEQWQKVLDKIKKHLLEKAREGAYTGKGIVELDFNKGGVTKTKLGLNWIED